MATKTKATPKTPSVLSGLGSLTSLLTHAFGNTKHPGYTVIAEAVKAAQSHDERAQYAATTVDLIREEQKRAGAQQWVACIGFLLLSGAAIILKSRTS